MLWAGNAAMDSGTLRIEHSEPVRQVVTAMEFGPTRSTVVFTLSRHGRGTRVTARWVSEHGINPVDRWFGAMLLDRWLGADLERGLSRLKLIIEHA